MPIDLNADIGESFGIYALGDDETLLTSVSSASVAAGFHAGDPSVMRRTIRLAAARRVSIGAHPSFPDLSGFGRREMHMPDWEVEDAVLYQIASVAGVAKAEGVPIRHVKPHGALYNMAARDRGLASAIVRAMVAFDGGLLLYAPPDSELERVGLDAGLSVVREGFADRTYEPDGRLVSRQRPGAVIADPQMAARQAVGLAMRGEAMTVDGGVVPLRVDSICVHGDLAGAAARAAAIRHALTAAGITVQPPPANQPN